MSNYPDGATLALSKFYREHNPRCEVEVWYRCPEDGLFQPEKIGRGENRCPDCNLMRARTDECVCWKYEE